MTESEQIEGIKLIRHNATGYGIDDDLSYPFRLDVKLRPPEFMVVAFIGLFGGTEEICVRSKTTEALTQFVKLNNLEQHPRLISLTISKPEHAK